jgi:hypothetical protein
MFKGIVPNSFSDGFDFLSSAALGSPEGKTKDEVELEASVSREGVGSIVISSSEVDPEPKKPLILPVVKHSQMSHEHNHLKTHLQ